MNDFNIFTSALAFVLVVLCGCFTYYNVVDSNNSKEIVTKAIERGVDSTTAACAAAITSNNRDVRSTCEKIAIIKGIK